MNNLALLILNAACDDWENIASIRADVESSPQGGPVESSELEACLLSLVREDLLDAHEFSTGTFVRLEPDAVVQEAIPRLWYFVTPAGRRLLDANDSFFDTPAPPDSPSVRIVGLPPLHL